MTNTLEPLGLGNKIAELKQKIMAAKNELSAIESPIKSNPELIESTNLLRENEYLSNVNNKTAQLLDWYQQYASELEKTFSMVFEIQNELKDLIKEHAKDITKSKKSKRQKKHSTKKKKPIKKISPKKSKSRRK